MKLHLGHFTAAFLLVVCVADLAVELRAARGTLPTVSKPRMQSLAIDVLYDDNDRVLALHVTGKYLRTVLQPDGVTRTKHLFSVTADLVGQAKQIVTVDNEFVALGSLVDDVFMLGDAAWRSSEPTELTQNRPPPEERRALRQKKTDAITRETGAAK